MITFNYLDLFNALAPETIVIVFAFLALLVDLAFLRRRPNRTRRTTGAGIAGAGCVAALLWLGCVMTTWATEYAFEVRTYKLFAINTFFWLFGMIIMGAIVGAWKKQGAATTN